MFEPDMKITAMHVKRKQLHQLLPDQVVIKKRKHSTEGLRAMNESGVDLCLDSDNSMTMTFPTSSSSAAAAKSGLSVSPPGPVESTAGSDSQGKADPLGGVAPVGAQGTPGLPEEMKPSSSPPLVSRNVGKRSGSPLQPEKVKRLELEEEFNSEVKASEQREGPATLEPEQAPVETEEKIETEMTEVGADQESPAQKIPSADLSDVPLLPANPFPVVKNSIKLRLSR